MSNSTSPQQQPTLQQLSHSPGVASSAPVAPMKPVAAASQEVPHVVSNPLMMSEAARLRRVRLACAATTAVLWWAAGQSWGLFALGWIAPTPLFWALQGASGRARLRLGFLTGCLAFALINWWIAPTIARAGEAIGVPFVPGVLLGVLAVALIAGIHGSLVALVAWLWNPSFNRDNQDVARAKRPGIGKRCGRDAALELCWPAFIALVWALLDAARSETPLAHAWGALAYTQWRDVALWQSAAVVGQHGLTWLCVWFAASLALWMKSANAHSWCLPVAVFAACHCWGALRLAQTPFMVQTAGLSTPTGASTLNGKTSAATAPTHEYLRIALERIALERIALEGGTTFATASLATASLVTASLATDSPEDGAFEFAKAAESREGLRVLLVQTDVPSLRKSVADEPFQQAYALTREAARKGWFDLVVWPETTCTLSLAARESNVARDVSSFDSGQMRAVAALSRDLQTPILFGARDVQPGGENFNRAVMMAPDGRFWSSDKERLVPFGERAPFAEYLPFLHRLAPQPEVSANGKARLLPLPPPPQQTPSEPAARHATPQAPRMSTHVAGARGMRIVQSVQANSVDVPVGAIICFESCFRFPARRLGLEGARALFVLTNDEWFGGTDAPWQHSVMAALRAVENDVPIAQAGNGGYSFAVDRRGRFMVKSSLNQARALPVFLPLHNVR